MNVNIDVLCKLLLNTSPSEEETSLLEGLSDQPFLLAVLNEHNEKTIIATWCVLKAVLNYNKKIAIITPSFRHSKVMYNIILGILEASPLDYMPAEKVKTVNYSKIELSNGSVIYSIPLGNGDKVRGMRFTDIIVNNVNSMGSEILEKVINDYLSILSPDKKGSQLILSENSEVKIRGWNKQIPFFNDSVPVDVGIFNIVKDGFKKVS